MQKTGIEYLTHTWNPIAMRCSPVSPGCSGCWHLKTADRMCKNMALPKDERRALEGTGPFVLRTRELDAPLRLKKPSRIGVQFMGDLFHEDVPDEFIMRVFDSMPTDLLQPCKHIYLILTKRVKRMHQFFDERTRYGTRPWPNVWLGVTVCNQEEADEKIPILLQIPAAVRFISIEPMLGSIDLQLAPKPYSAIAWVILGGETGPGARPMNSDWALSIKNQCVSAGVPFFFKAWGSAWGKYVGRLLDGKEHNELPEVAR